MFSNEIPKCPGVFYGDINKAIENYSNGGLKVSDFSVNQFLSSENEYREKIKENIRANTPVILFYGAGKNNQIEIYNYSKFMNSCLKRKQSVGAHFVIVTGIVENKNENEVYYIISTWGEKCIIRESEIFSSCSDIIAGDSVRYLIIEKRQ